MITLDPDLVRASREGRGQGLRILLLDSGVEAEHPHFQGRQRAAFVLDRTADGGWRVDPEPPQDVFGHGTAICAVLQDQAPEAEIHSLRVLNRDLRAPAESVLAGMEWGIQERYDLLHCSFGTLSPQWVPAFKRIVDLAYCANVWIVAAAAPPGTHLTDLPADFPSVFTTGLAGKGETTIRYRPGSLVEFLAPGEAVRVPWKGGSYRICTGSSFAAPCVTALLARTFGGRVRPPGGLGKALIQTLLEQAEPDRT